MCLALRCRRTLSVLENRYSYDFVRGCSNKDDTKGVSDKKTNPTRKLSSQTVRQNVKGYVFTRLIEYVQNYDKVLEKNFPSAVKVYRVFFDGVRDFYSDMKRYLKITRILTNSSNGLKALNRRELELYIQMPRDMFKVAPTIILSSLPLVGYAVFPLAYMYPRTFLTSHFWTLQQKAKFQELALTERLHNNRAVLRYLQANLKTTEKHQLHVTLKHVLGLLGSGFHPTVETLLKMKDIFVEPPYNLDSLSSQHIKKLCLIHELKSGWLFNRHRLIEHAYILHSMDRAIRKEGGAHNMPQEAMKHSCYIRGLNPTNLSNAEMVEWLQNWVQISLSLEENHISFYLHLPLFLGYNHPNNWLLVYEKQNQNSHKF